MSGSWGIELWDKYKEAYKVISDTADEFETVHKGFMKERSKLETEYALKLKKLVKTYSSKVAKKKHHENDEELTRAIAFRNILDQVIYQANQHELIAESLGIDLIKDVDSRVTEVRKELQENNRKAVTLKKTIEGSYKALDSANHKYQRSHNEQENAKANYERGEVDGTYSRNDVLKLKDIFVTKTRENDDSKGHYANQLGQTNKDQEEYFNVQLVSVLDGLETLHRSNTDFWKGLMEKCLKSELNVVPIIAKCHEDMMSAVGAVNSDTDAEVVVTNLKTGNVPPSEIPFEELEPGLCLSAKSSTLSRSRSNLMHDGQNLYQKKRELEKHLHAKEAEVAAVQKEHKALNMMVDTYRNNPNFGDTKQFLRELDAVTTKMQKLESEAQTLRNELAVIQNGLDHNGSPALNRSRSQMSVTPSIKSQDSAPIGHNDFVDDFDDEFNDEVSVPVPPAPPVSNYQNVPPPPPPPGPVVPPTPTQEPVAVALFDFQTDSEDTLTMAEGDRFRVIEPDLDGWTSVQRLEDGVQGFVPSAYIEIQ